MNVTNSKQRAKTRASGCASHGRKVYICSTTKFCEINHHHTTELRDFLIGNGCEVVAEPDQASDILIMTCGALQSSEDRSVAILEQLRLAHPDKSFYITGCLPAIRPDLPILENVTVIRVGDLVAIKQAFSPSSRQNDTRTCRIDYEFIGLPDQNPNRFTIVVVQGCLGSCTYCAIRKAKGRAKSLAPDTIAERFESIIQDHQEPSIALLGEDLGSYGSDIESDPVQLLHRLTAYHGHYKIEIQNFEPSRLLLFYGRLRQIFAGGRIVKMHVAVQTGSQKLLAKMGRNYDIPSVVEILKDLQSVAPNLVLETSFIINFPGETRQDFLQTLSLLPEFDEVVVFDFSPRPGTRAANFQEEIPAEVKANRRRMVERLRDVHPGLAIMFS